MVIYYKCYYKNCNIWTKYYLKNGIRVENLFNIMKMVIFGKSFIINNKIL